MPETENGFPDRKWWWWLGWWARTFECSQGEEVLPSPYLSPDTATWSVRIIVDWYDSTSHLFVCVFIICIFRSRAYPSFVSRLISEWPFSFCRFDHFSDVGFGYTCKELGWCPVYLLTIDCHGSYCGNWFFLFSLQLGGGLEFWLVRLKNTKMCRSIEL